MIIKNTIFLKTYRNFHHQNIRFNSILKILSNNNIGDEIEVKGWVKSLRKQKEIIFIDINDGSTDRKLQIISPQSTVPPNLTTGSSIKSYGKLNLSPKGQLELSATNLEVYGTCPISEGYPFAPRKSYEPEYIRQHLQFRPRTNKFSSVLRVRHTAASAIHNYFDANDFINVQTPILTSNDCEGAGEVFTVTPENASLLKAMERKGVRPEETYFNTKVFLTVSGQLHLEAVAHGLSKVYTFGPTFRAENARSRLHLSEFYMVEAETAFVDNLNDIVNQIENLIKTVTKRVLDRNLDDVKRCCDKEMSEIDWLDKKFPVITYEEAADILRNNQSRIKEKFVVEEGLSKEHEIFLANYCGKLPTFVVNWPKELKSFYMKELTDDTSKVQALDLLAPNVGEIAGGSIRENNYDKLLEKLPNAEQLKWYLDLRKYGGVTTGGFGLGFERYLQYILGIDNIKDVIPFPRWPHNCSL